MVRATRRNRIQWFFVSAGFARALMPSSTLQETARVADCKGVEPESKLTHLSDEDAADMAGAAVIDCVIAWLYNQEMVAAQSARGKRTEGRVSFRLFDAFEDFGGGPVSSDDSLLLLASGYGAEAFRAHFATEIGTVVGLGSDRAQHAAAAAARERALAEVRGWPVQRRLDFITDPLSAWGRHLEQATLVKMESHSFDPPSLVELSWLLPQHILPGAVVLSVGARSPRGCLAGLVLVRTMLIASSWEKDALHDFVHIYIGAPRTSLVGWDAPWLLPFDSSIERSFAADFRKHRLPDMSGNDMESSAVLINTWTHELRVALDNLTLAESAVVSKRLRRLHISVERTTEQGSAPNIGCKFCQSTYDTFAKADVVWRARPFPEILRWETWRNALLARAGGEDGPAHCIADDLQVALEIPDGNLSDRAEGILWRMIQQFAPKSAELGLDGEGFAEDTSKSVGAEIACRVVAESDGQSALRAVERLASAWGSEAVGRIRDASGKSPLHSVASAAVAERLLRAWPAAANATDASHEMPLHKAAGRFPPVVDALLRHGAAVDPPDDMGMTPLHRAAMVGDVLSSLSLLQARAAPDVPDRFGKTPLNWGVRAGPAKLVESLLRAKADPGQRDASGKAMRDIAERSGHQEIVALLEAAVSASVSDAADGIAESEL